MSESDLLTNPRASARLILALAGLTRPHAEELRETLGAEEALLDATRPDLIRAGLSPAAATRIREILRTGEHHHSAERIEALSGRILIHDIPPYPPRLAGITQAPLALFLRGRAKALTGPLVAMVGSRRCSAEGRALARRLGRGLAQAGWGVVSGLARGIDGAAMRGGIEGGGPVVGVMGCGLDVIYPDEHVRLYQDTARAGALVTEFPLAAQPLKMHFPRRNRIITGLAEALIVVEASNRSGSLISVDHALAQDRLVMAVPGPVGPSSFRGSNRLIRDGALVVLDVDDVLAALPGGPGGEWKGASPGPLLNAAVDTRSSSGSEATILAAARHRALTVDELMEATGLDLDPVLRAVSRLEDCDRITRCPGGRFLAGGPG